MVLGHLRAWRDGHADVVTDTVARAHRTGPMSARNGSGNNMSQFSGKPSLMQKAAHKMNQSAVRRSRSGVRLPASRRSPVNRVA